MGLKPLGLGQGDGIGPERGDQELFTSRRSETGMESEKLCDVRCVPLLPGTPQERASG